MNRYTHRVEWSLERYEYVGVCVEFPSLSHYAPTLRDAIAGIEEAVDQYVAELQMCSDKVPAPP